MRKMKQDEKKLALRIIMLILAVSMILGFVLLPLGQSAASAEEVTDTVVTSFATGSLSSAIETAKDGTDLNNITGIKVSGGTLNAAEYQAICGYPNIVTLDLSGADTEDGVIPASALASRNKLSVIYLPANTKEIGEGALSGNRSLTEVYMPSSVRIIGDHAFEGCEKVEHFDIPAETEKIGASAFADCKALAGFVLPAGITEIPDRCFEKTSLRTIILGPQVTAIGSGAFENCHDLTDIICYGDNAPTSPTGAFQNCKVVFHAHEGAEGYDDIGDMASGMASVVYDLDGEYKPPVNSDKPSEPVSVTQPAENETENAVSETVVTTSAKSENETSPAEISAVTEAPAEKTPSQSGGFNTASVVIIAILCIAVGVFATLFFTSRKK